MRIFLAGATGALGSRLVPAPRGRRPRRHRHDPHRPAKAAALRAAGAEPVVADGLDRDAVVAAVAAARPDVIVNQLTALSAPRLDARLRRRLRRHQPPAHRGHGAPAGRRAGRRRAAAPRAVLRGLDLAARRRRPKTEADGLDPHPVGSMRATLEAMRRMEALVLGARDLEGIVLRYGGFYGPGTGMVPGGEQVELVRKRRFPVVGDGGGVWSFIHIDDAAAATLAAIERGAPGVYNVVDDDPAPAREWLPALAAAAGAKPPRHVPRWLARLAAGEAVDDADDRHPRRVERQGAARAGLGPGAPELARGLPGRARGGLTVRR